MPSKNHLRTKSQNDELSVTTYMKLFTINLYITVLVFQWLCNKDKSCHNPVKRLYALFSSLYGCLVSTLW
jgi:hypothetical protein